jgi:hypothetical protein
MNGIQRFVVYARMRLSQTLLIVAVVCGLMAGSALAGSDGVKRSSFRPETRLIIKRAPNFGNHTALNLYINGRHVASFTYGRHYEGVLPAGDYLVTMKQTPHLSDAYPYSEQWIRVVPGRTNIFTAFWRDSGERIVLDLGG